MKGMQATARSLGVELQSAQVKAYLTPGFGYGYGNGSRSIESAFTWATRGQAGAFVLLPSSILGENLELHRRPWFKKASSRDFLASGLRRGRRPYGLRGEPN